MDTRLVTDGVCEGRYHDHTEYHPTPRAHGVVGLSRSLSMREVSGSIPDVSIWLVHYTVFFLFGPQYDGGTDA